MQVESLCSVMVDGLMERISCRLGGKVVEKNYRSGQDEPDCGLIQYTIGTGFDADNVDLSQGLR